MAYVEKNYDIVSNKAAAQVKDGHEVLHIANSYEDYEAARSGFFVFQPVSGDPVLDLIAKQVGKFNQDSELTANEVQELFKLDVVKAKVPHFSLEVLEYRRGNEKVKFAGVPTFDSGSITIDDIVGVDTKSLVEAWLELGYNLDTRAGGRMYEYKMDCNLIEYTQDYRPIRTWLLKGCFVSAYSEGDFDKESDGKRQIEVTIEYDRATMVRGVAGKGTDVNKIAQ